VSRGGRSEGGTKRQQRGRARSARAGRCCRCQTLERVPPSWLTAFVARNVSRVCLVPAKWAVRAAKGRENTYAGTVLRDQKSDALWEHGSEQGPTRGFEQR